ncbi:MAG: hypothetical protein KF810_13415 [Rhizobiaceae bacterium]|nr:hypothetical protein [Rhizobiaceae bacterium]
MANLTPSTLTLVTAVTYRHYEKHGITSDDGWENVGAAVLALYERGMTSEEELLAALERRDMPHR